MKIFNLSFLSGLVLLNCFTVMGQTGNWEVLKTENQVANRSECGLAVVNGKLYLIGGDSGGPQSVESFDPKTLTWTKLSQAPLTMHHFQAVPYNEKIYVLEAFSAGGFPNQD